MTNPLNKFAITIRVDNNKYLLTCTVLVHRDNWGSSEVLQGNFLLYPPPPPSYCPNFIHRELHVAGSWLSTQINRNVHNVIHQKSMVPARIVRNDSYKSQIIKK